MKLKLQSESSECGLACLAMVAGYFGQPFNISDLRRTLGLSSKGMTLKGVIQAAQQLQLASRALQLTLAELGQLQTPCILHWDLNHFVVLKMVGRTGVTILDPAVG